MCIGYDTATRQICQADSYSILIIHYRSPPVDTQTVLAMDWLELMLWSIHRKVAKQSHAADAIGKRAADMPSIQLVYIVTGHETHWLFSVYTPSSSSSSSVLLHTTLTDIIIYFPLCASVIYILKFMYIILPSWPRLTSLICIYTTFKLWSCVCQ